MRRVAEDFAVQPKTVFMLTRLAVTGLEKTPPLHAILLLLGPERVRTRMAQAIAGLSAPVPAKEGTNARP
jgi:glutamyl/glutaminyl-tRNA synthetase